MDVVCLLGSPRRGGNSETIARRFTDAAEALGARVRTYALNELDYRGCQACWACKSSSEACILEDDLTDVLEAVRDCDILVMASPVYFGEVTGQMKLAIDRLFSFLVPGYGTSRTPSRLAPGKSLVFVIAQGHPKEKLYADIFPRYEWFLKWMGFRDTVLIRGVGVYEPGDAEARADLLAEAEAAAARLVGSGQA